MSTLDEYIHNPHSEDITDDIIYIYVVALILWFLLIYTLDLISKDLISFVILLIPVALYLISIYTVHDSDKDIEKGFLQSDILAFSVIIITITLNLERNSYSPFFSKLMTVGLLLLMFSFVDFWVSKYDYLYVLHIKSILRIAAMTIFLYMIYIYHILNVREYGCTINPLKEN